MYPFDKIVRLGIFDEPLKDLIHHMKYHGRWTLGEQLAGVLAETDRIKQLVRDETVLVPVPLHYLRQISRGYNQADVIARRLRQSLGCQLDACARRTRDTETQTQIHAHADREKNVRGAFALKRAGAVAGKRVVIVDDVMTTGSTLRSLARTLSSAKPASISAIVLAVADPRRNDFQVI
jgi:competence protein ComFC